MRTRSVLIAGVLVGALAFAACGGDDGGGVREIGGASGSGTASGGSGSGSGGSGSGSGGSGSGSGTNEEAAPECRPFGDMSTATSTVNVTFNEWVIALDVNTAPAGKVAFVAKNEGKEPHELVVLHGPATNLPTDEDGALDESKLAGGTLVGEIEPFPAGETCDGTFELTPGDYTLVCNVVEDEKGKHESHLKEGMVTAFTVT
jgi:hypothetical protein